MLAGREKTPFSIWRKIQNKKISLEHLTDIIGFRIVVGSIDDCYKALGVLHNRYSAIPFKFKDYISTPKINKYQSIHTAIIGPKEQRIEIQIRTHQMHDFAERGIASHWKYKSSEKLSDLSWKEYDWLRDLVEIMETGNSPEHYYEFTKLQMFQENVFCFTPKGAVIKLPRDATPIDFAYAVHTNIGNTAISCRINGSESALQSHLYNGDTVEVINSKNVSPSLHWISSSKTGKARAAIRRYWQDKSENNISKKRKVYTSTLLIDLPDQPGVLGEVSTLIGLNGSNILNVELVRKKDKFLQFSFDLQINDLKNFTNLISQIKQKNLIFKIIRHKQKKNAFIQRFFKSFKRN
jgi:guanosine-3',5'-bis(diphosphate) 3'-pyrophosphohydrolase